MSGRLMEISACEIRLAIPKSTSMLKLKANRDGDESGAAARANGKDATSGITTNA